MLTNYLHKNEELSLDDCDDPGIAYSPRMSPPSLMFLVALFLMFVMVSGSIYSVWDWLGTSAPVFEISTTASEYEYLTTYSVYETEMHIYESKKESIKTDLIFDLLFCLNYSVLGIFYYLGEMHGRRYKTTDKGLVSFSIFGRATGILRWDEITRLTMTSDKTFSLVAGEKYRGIFPLQCTEPRALLNDITHKLPTGIHLPKAMWAALDKHEEKRRRKITT